MPAVSTSTKVRSPRWSTVSIASRVVPGTSETITRSSPSKALSRLDLPTFGRPRMATRIASSPTSCGPLPGSMITTASSRSPVPWPCWAESGTGSPSPSRWNSKASASWSGSSILFASRITGLRALAEDRRELLVARRDPGARVDDEQDQVGLCDRGVRLIGDRARDRRLVGDVDAAGVDQPEALAVPVGDELLAVAGDTRRLVHHGRPRLGQPVDERRLADVRKADDRDRARERRNSLDGGVLKLVVFEGLMRVAARASSPGDVRRRPRGSVVTSATPSAADARRLAGVAGACNHASYGSSRPPEALVGTGRVRR